MRARPLFWSKVCWEIENDPIRVCAIVIFWRVFFYEYPSTIGIACLSFWSYFMVLVYGLIYGLSLYGLSLWCMWLPENGVLAVILLFFYPLVF